LARRSLKPQLNQIRTWVRQGRTDAWIAHQLEVSVKDISAFKTEHALEAGDVAGAESDLFGPRVDEEEPDLRAEDEALVAAALEAEQDEPEPEDDADEGDSGSDGAGNGDGEGDGQKRRRRGRRGGRGRGRGRKPLEGTFDHGEEGYGLWLDPAVQDNPVYAEHWAGQRAIKVEIEADRILITRAGEDAAGGDGEADSEE
jgi:hypothetical protein